MSPIFTLLINLSTDLPVTTKTLSKFDKNNVKYIGFMISDLSGIAKKDINDFIKTLNYKTAYYTRLRYKTNGIELNDNRLKLVICEYTRFIEFVEIEPHIDN